MGLGRGNNGTGSKSPGSAGKGGEGLAWQAGEDVKLVGQEILNDWEGSRYFLQWKEYFFVEQVAKKRSSGGIRERGISNPNIDALWGDWGKEKSLFFLFLIGFSSSLECFLFPSSLHTLPPPSFRSLLCLFITKKHLETIGDSETNNNKKRNLEMW